MVHKRNKEILIENLRHSFSSTFVVSFKVGLQVTYFLSAGFYLTLQKRESTFISGLAYWTLNTPRSRIIFEKSDTSTLTYSRRHIHTHAAEWMCLIYTNANVSIRSNKSQFNNILEMKFFNPCDFIAERWQCH